MFSAKEWIRSRSWITLLLPLMAMGCSSGEWRLSKRTAPPRGANTYRYMDPLPAHVRRAAVLPVTWRKDNWYAAESGASLQPVLLAEISKLQRFEVVSVSRQQLKNWTGQESWQSDSTLPSALFSKLIDDLGCDAVLFTHLQSYHPYQPVVVGWKVHLIDLRLRSVLWAADETFDASHEWVADAARDYYKNQTWQDRNHGDSDRILISPQRFSQFTLASLLHTVPGP